MPELLLELGCEELPAAFVRKAFEDLHRLVAEGLRASGIGFTDDRGPIGTPRRLIVSFSHVEPRQPDQTKESRGPAVDSAYDADGRPTPALQGFCRGQGVETSSVEQRDGYVWAVRTVGGRGTAELLAEILPAAIRALTFEKTMRWGSGRMRFARPIRWILASFDGEPVSFEVEGVRSGLSSRGHRFYSPEAFEARSYDELLDGLMARQVEPDPRERERTIREVTMRTASSLPDMPDDLVEENVYLTEWPTPVEGNFKVEYLELPEPVLVTAMAKHEKMFPLRDEAGKIVNRFVFVRNSGEDATVRSGAEWVLNARFNDAKFFYDEDRKWTMADFLQRGSQIVFQERLGTVRQRADRLSQLAEWIAGETGAGPDEVEFAKAAGLYAKADLACGLVSELASLQGIVGGEYARREGMPDPVCHAIATQYDLAKNMDRDCPGSRTALRVLLADQVDKLAGYLGIGQVPTGSSDPMGLRRAATLCIEASWKRWDLDYAGLLAIAVTLYARQDVDLDVEGAKSAARAIFAGRYETLLEGERHDLVAAATMEDHGWEALRPKRVLERLSVAKALAPDSDFIQTATRPLNIVRAAREKREPFEDEISLSDWDRSALRSESGERLLAALLSATAGLSGAQSERVEALRGLAVPINDYFAETMIMSSDPAERAARLTVAQAACRALLTAGDLAKIVLEGDGRA